MAEKTPNPSGSRKGRSISDTVPTLPVRAKEAVTGPFFITDTPSGFDGRYGRSWRLTCTDPETGEAFLVLLQSNAVRDDWMAAVTAAFGKSDEPIGPVKFSHRRLESGRETWEIIDA